MDRAALDAALAAGFSCGGWCPRGRKAEDGRIPDRYPLQELTSAAYLQRTRRNVLASDGTVIIYSGQISGGTARTFEFCRQEHKPFQLIDAAEVPPAAAAGQVAEFVAREAIRVLNVAGPRASGWPGAARYTADVIRRVLHTGG